MEGCGESESKDGVERWRACEGGEGLHGQWRRKDKKGKDKKSAAEEGEEK